MLIFILHKVFYVIVCRQEMLALLMAAAAGKVPQVRYGCRVEDRVRRFLSSEAVGPDVLRCATNQPLALPRGEPEGGTGDPTWVANVKFLYFDLK